MYVALWSVGVVLQPFQAPVTLFLRHLRIRQNRRNLDQNFTAIHAWNHQRSSESYDGRPSESRFGFLAPTASRQEYAAWLPKISKWVSQIDARDGGEEATTALAQVRIPNSKLRS